MSGIASPTSRITGSVHIIGAGLLGSSIGLGLRAKNVQVTLADISSETLALAVDYGAGVPLGADMPEPDLVVVATPPDQTAKTVQEALSSFAQAVVTDVASVKHQILLQLQKAGVDTRRYVGSHPMAGRERGGTIMARADLFVGRPWVICRDANTPAWALGQVESLALELGAVPAEWGAAEHDAAVAAVSHLPQVISSALAAQLLNAKTDYLTLAGAGLRDTTRIAASDPALWVQILAANKDSVASHLENLAADIAGFAAALRNPDSSGSRVKIAKLLAAGNEGVARIPGKHGSAHKFAALNIIIADKPGQLAKLFSDLDELAINLEDIRLEHSPGAAIGFVELSVQPEDAELTAAGLRARDWRII